jgi:hypothetical protein
LLAHPTQTRILFLRCKQGLFRSSNAGDNWEKLADTPGQLLAPDYTISGRILWAKDDGLWASTDSGTTWQAIMPGYELIAPRALIPLFLPSVSTDDTP